VCACWLQVLLCEETVSLLLLMLMLMLENGVERQAILTAHFRDAAVCHADVQFLHGPLIVT
jgi:hypothetical protein